MQHKILLLDELGEKWGKTHVYHNLKSPSEALKLLYINHPDLCKYFATAHEDGIGFTVVQAGEFLDYEDLGLPLGKNDLVITPVISGSGGKGFGKILLGAALISVGVFSGGTGLSLGAGGVFGFTGGSIAAISGNIGIALVLSGVSDMLFPLPQQQSFSTEADPQLSFSFSGVQNTSRAGTPVPIVYGEIFTGSVVISAAIDTNQIEA